MKAKQILKNVHTITDSIIVSQIEANSIIVDATAGNGNDTLKLARLIGTEGKIYAFDIQKSAIEKTRELLLNEGLYGNNVELIEDSHSNVDLHVKENIDFAIMNLGYLPGGDKSIFTKSESTISFIEQASEMLNPRGLILIVFYIGFIDGADEARAVTEYLTTLDQKRFNVTKIEFLNQKNLPPYIALIERA